MAAQINPNPTALEKIRREAGLSRKKLGEISGVSFRLIEQYEQRYRTINGASVVTVYALAKALNVPIENLIEPEEETEKL